MEQLNPGAETTEAQVLRACALKQEKPVQWEAHAEKSSHSNKDIDKNNNNNIYTYIHI